LGVIELDSWQVTHMVFREVAPDAVVDVVIDGVRAARVEALGR